MFRVGGCCWPVARTACSTCLLRAESARHGFTMYVCECVNDLRALSHHDGVAAHSPLTAACDVLPVPHDSVPAYFDFPTRSCNICTRCTAGWCCGVLRLPLADGAEEAARDPRRGGGGGAPGEGVCGGGMPGEESAHSSPTPPLSLSLIPSP